MSDTSGLPLPRYGGTRKPTRSPLTLRAGKACHAHLARLEHRIGLQRKLDSPSCFGGLVDTQDDLHRPTAFVPIDQAELWGSSVQLAVRARGAPSGLIPPVIEASREVHPGISLEFRTLREQVARSLARPRLLALLSGFFGALALLLAVVGLYGTMAYDVARRRSEIGVRIALGARRSGILRMVAGEAGGTVALGVVLGGALTLATTRGLAAFLYGVTALDPTVLVLSALILATVAMAAGLVPAWRAAGVDPMQALRDE